MTGFCRTRLPKSLRRRMVAVGAKQKKATGEDLYVLEIEGTDSPAWSIYEEWALGLEADPFLGAAFAPSPAIAQTVLNPGVAVSGPLMVEVQSILAHLGPMNIQAYATGLIPGPLAAPPSRVNFHHCRVAVIGLVEHLQRPPPNYPVLSGLRAGSYVCTLYYEWTGAAVTVNVYKHID